MNGLKTKIDKMIARICVLLFLIVAVPSVVWAEDANDEEIEDANDEEMDICGIAAPQYLQAYKTANKEITVSWDGPSNASGFEVYMKKGNGKYHKVKNIKQDAPHRYEAKGLSPSGTYKFRVRSYRAWPGGAIRYCSSYITVSVNMKKQPLPKNLSVGKSLAIKLGQQKKIAVKCTKGTESKYIKGVTYRVKDKEIACVKPSGVVQGKKPGKTEVTVCVNLKSGLYKVFTVKVKVPVPR